MLSFTLMYITIKDLSECKPLPVRQKLCSKLYVSKLEALCEDQQLKNFNKVPEEVRKIFSKGYESW